MIYLFIIINFVLKRNQRKAWRLGRKRNKEAIVATWEATMAEQGSVLQFAPFQSAVDEGFWHRLSSLKLNKLGIDDSPIPISGAPFFFFFFASKPEYVTCFCSKRFWCLFFIWFFCMHSREKNYESCAITNEFFNFVKITTQLCVRKLLNSVPWMLTMKSMIN